MRTTSTGSSPRRERFRGPAAGAPEIPQRPDQVRAVLHGLGVRASRRYGQSFLADPFIADAEAALVETGPGEPILEVGGGLGILTAALLRRGVRPLTVVERDRRLAGFLRFQFGARVGVVDGDALEIPLDGYRAAVGNLPFSAATPIFLRLVERRIPRVVALVQREVGARLTAVPGTRAYGRLTILTSFFGSVERFQDVPGSAFVPEPDVDGTLVRFHARAGPLPSESSESLERWLRLLFSSRRKQLGNLLPRWAGSESRADELADRALWPSDWSRLRPEALPPDAFFRLANLGAPTDVERPASHRAR